MSANIHLMETVHLLSPDKGDMSGFSGPSCISAMCRFAPWAGLSRVTAG